MFKPCPPAGSGQVNLWTFGAACEGVRQGWSQDEIRKYLFQETTHSGEEAEYEIERAVERAFEQGANSTSQKWPAVDSSLLESVQREHPGLDAFRDLSPASKVTAAEALEQLFPDNPLLWAAASVHPERDADTLPMREWLDVAEELQFIVPNPMVSREVRPGRFSRRCLENTGPRRFLIIESDRGTPDEQAAVLWDLANYAPLRAVVFSGGKSFHGWFNVAERDESWGRAFMERAVSLGADRATWNRSQPVRMPGGSRPEKRARQEIVFFAETYGRGAR